MARKTRKRNRTRKRPPAQNQATSGTQLSEMPLEPSPVVDCGVDTDAEESALGQITLTNELDGQAALVDDTSEDPVEDTTVESDLTAKVESNARLMERLLDQFDELREHLVNSSSDRELLFDHHDTADQETNESVVDGVEATSPLMEELKQQVAEYQDRIAELEQQNSDLASQVASSSVQQTVACADSGSGDALSWEDRKKLILQQMEEDSFDAESFISGMHSTESDQPLDPVSFVEELHSELARKDEEIKRRDDEIGELRCLLEQQSGTREGGIAVGAAAIAQMIDSDELVQQERERLQNLQEQWQEKFRQGEIEASLERAKLSRERLELARKSSELEERLEHLSRETRHAEESGTTSRRWLVKLGLADSDR